MFSAGSVLQAIIFQLTVRHIKRTVSITLPHQLPELSTPTNKINISPSLTRQNDKAQLRHSRLFQNASAEGHIQHKERKGEMTV